MFLVASTALWMGFGDLRGWPGECTRELRPFARKCDEPEFTRVCLEGVPRLRL